MSAEAARTGKELIDATRPYAVESKAQSWLQLVVTLVAWLGLVAVLTQPIFWPARFLLAIVCGLVEVRMFILYHDHMHGALLRSSAVAHAFFTAYGVWILAPPKVWRETHNYHHAHTAQLVGSHIGSFPTMTVAQWQQATPEQRRQYAFTRHPLTVLNAYFTAFLLEMCLLSFKRAPRKRWDSLLAAFVALGIAVGTISIWGFSVWFWAIFLPHYVACAAGAYLFYAQHNYPDLEIQPRELWSYDRAALRSSSYMRLGPVLRWFTGNIGYHHVHHLNSGIPFYRLPEAMQAIPELQSPGVTDLSPTSIRECFALKLWDPVQKRMVGYPG